MFESKDIDGIFCIRGGYGSCRIVEKLDLDVIRANQGVCLVTGYYIYYLVFNQICNMVTFHGPMVEFKYDIGI